MSQFIKIHKSYRFWLLIIPPLISLSLYFSSLNYFFFQDDFYEINIARVNNMGDFLAHFKFLENRSSYRPIGLQTYFYVSQKIFGLNAAGFRIITFIFLFASYFLIIKLVEKITNNRLIGVLTATFWVTSSVLFMAITWIAAAWNIIGTFFYLLTSVTFMSYLKTNKSYWYVLTLLFFLLTLGSFEFFISWPLVAAYYLLFLNKKNLKITLKLLSPFFLISIAYIILRLRYSYLPNISEYKIEIGIDTIKNLFWYVLWTFNIPEEFKKQIIHGLIIPNTTFAKEFASLIAKSILSSVLIVLLGFILPILKNFKSRNINWRMILFGIVWFVASIAPVLILPNHAFAMYLILASIGIYFVMSYLIASRFKAPVIIAIFLIWVFSSFTTISFYKDSSWMIDSQNFARQFAIQLKSRFPQLPQDAVVFYPLSDKRHIQAVLNQNEIKVIYNDPSISIFYNEADFIKYLKENPTNNIYKF